MAKTRKTPEAASSAASTDQLSRNVQALTERVETLTQHVEALYQVLDEIRDQFDWALKNDKLGGPANDRRPVMHITSMPKDPCAPDFGERINRFTAKDLPPEAGSEGAEDATAESLPTNALPAHQRELWE